MDNSLNNQEDIVSMATRDDASEIHSVADVGMALEPCPGNDAERNTSSIEACDSMDTVTTETGAVAEVGGHGDEKRTSRQEETSTVGTEEVISHANDQVGVGAPDIVDDTCDSAAVSSLPDTGNSSKGETDYIAMETRSTDEDATSKNASDDIRGETRCAYDADYHQVPYQLTGAWQDFQHSPENFLKGCKWSPDGSCVLTNSDDSVLRLFNLPQEVYSSTWQDQNIPEMTSVLNIHEGELIYDYAWFPPMTSYQPETCCFASCCRGHPVHLWDAFTGELRGTYKPHNHLDEMATPHSLAFSPDGTKIYCGFNKMIRVFDTDRPGNTCEDRPTKVKNSGQSGIISCFAVNQDGLYAAGSYSKTIGLYTEPSGNMICMVQGQVGGVTHLMFSPDGNRLYSGGRKDQEIICWDLRNPGHVLFSLIREVTTNQRMYFDIDSTGRYLVSGNQDGTVSTWDTTQPPVTQGSTGDSVIDPIIRFAAHSDTVNGVSLNPALPIMATASGQRKFPAPMAMGDSDDDGEDDSAREDEKGDNSLRLWYLMPSS